MPLRGVHHPWDDGYYPSVIVLYFAALLVVSRSDAELLGKILRLKISHNGTKAQRMHVLARA